jgi:hypothetical protein
LVFLLNITFYIWEMPYATKETRPILYFLYIRERTLDLDY